VVILVSPPSPFLLDQYVFPQLGILKVAASLERADEPVRVLDLADQDAEQGCASISAAILSQPGGVSPVRIAGFTATTPQFPQVATLLAHARQLGLVTVLGGPHATLVVAAARREQKKGIPGRATRGLERLLELADIVIAGDGEKAILEALKPGMRGLIDADDSKGAMWVSENEQEDPDLWPARHLIDLPRYKYEIDRVAATSFVGQLGCVFACNFCGGRYSPMLRRARYRSADSVVAEIEHIYNTYGFMAYMAYDDELNLSGPRLIELCNALVAMQKRLGKPGEFRFRGFVKSELFDAAQADAMYQAGFRWILCGYESGSERILQNIQKRATREDNTRCLRVAKAAGLKVKALMSVGHAGETLETIHETETWLLAEKPDDFDVTVITTFPGTPYYDDAVETAPGVWTYSAKNGDRLHSLELDYALVADYYKGRPGDYKAYVFTDELSRSEIVFERDAMERRVRAKLGLAFPSAAVKRTEQSMGQNSSG
jgi:anaerobic magnesium-protoporphyrin IX monomethyl ester cyclase